MRTLAGFGLLLLVGSVATATPKVVTTKRFSFVLPEGYEDISSKFQKPDFVALEAQRTSPGYSPTIVLQRVPVAGGSMGDPTICTSTGKSIASDVNGKLQSASIISGPLGKTCQIHIVAPSGVSLITELNVMQERGLPKETWLMTCNHADGDKIAQRLCKETLAALKFSK